MPRIDPIQLLNCLSVLLSPDGGIKSRDEVQRLASLMTKFSKKLVSKCIYIQILKCTETSLLGLFMGSGGWRLIHMWLTESIVAKNWPLVRELLELLLLCPVDIERLKTNNCPKLVKELSKDGNHIAIRALASKLVEQWLKTVKGEHVTPIKNCDIPKIINDAQLELNPEVVTKNETHTQLEYGNKIKNEVKSESDVEHIVKSDKVSELTDKTDTSVVVAQKEADDKPEINVDLKLNVKGDKVSASPTQDGAESRPSEKSTEKEKVHDKDKKSDKDKSDKEKSKDKHKSKHKDRSSSKSDSSSSKSSSSKHSSQSSSEKHRSSHKRNDSPSPKSSKDKSKDKDKHSSSSKAKHSENKKTSDKTEKSNSSSSKLKEDRNAKTSEKDRSKDKVKDTSSTKPIIDKLEQKPEPPSIQKLGKIPKLSDAKKEKPSISIEIRKPDEPKPKTVKTFHSKFRKHGLEEEIKPPPSRATLLSKKVSPIVPPPTAPIPKRPSPVHNETPPEKKPKIVEIVDKPGAIKLIPPKPKPMMLLESDMFMDALNASATNKKEPKKRKRRTSGSKDGNAPGENSPPHTPTTVTSPNGENKSVPPKFYQDTLDTEEEKPTENASDISENLETDNVTEKAKLKTEEPMEITESHTLTVNGLKGVLCYHKRKGPKKSIKWKPDSELEEIQYFELDETERVNVTKTFTDMKYLERIHEREAFQKGRNLANDDVMEEKTSWAHLIPIDLDGQIEVEYGKNSKEKDIQAIRQKGTLQPLYFHKAMIPDSALEPDTETHTYSEPIIIPLEDVTGNQDNISDFRNMPWPEPKGNAPPASSNISVPPMFPPQFPGGFPPAQFPGMPGFQGPNMVPSDWQNGVPPHIIANGMPIPMNPNALAPGAMPPVNMPPGLLVSPENMIMGTEMFGGPSPLFPGPPEGFGMPQNMFPPDFNMSGPAGPPGPEGFSGPDSFPGTDAFSGPNNFRGAMRGRGSGGHWRGKNSGNWDGSQRGRGGGSRGNRKAVCIYFQRKGSCRQGDNCAFLHPGVNCPY